MCSFELVERLEEQGHKHYSDLWRVAACMLRLTEPWHECPRILPADDWFSWMPISFALVQEGLYSVVNIKTHTKIFCKEDLWEDTRPRLLSFKALSGWQHQAV
jgi:hypothetical protein